MNFTERLQEQAEDFSSCCEYECSRKALFNGIEYNDIDMSNMFEQDGFRYARYDAISFICESTMAYFGLLSLIFLLEDYPETAYWEYHYPNNEALKVAIGVLVENEKLDSLIKFPKWISVDTSEFKQRVDKYKLCDL